MVLLHTFYITLSSELCCVVLCYVVMRHVQGETQDCWEKCVNCMKVTALPLNRTEEHDMNMIWLCSYSYPYLISLNYDRNDKTYKYNLS